MSAVVKSDTLQQEDMKSQEAAQNAESLRRKRSLAVSLALVIVLAAGVVIGVMTATHLSEPEAPPDSPELQALKADLAKDPDNDSLKASVRWEDLRLRRQYRINRRRFEIRAWLLLIGIALAMACVKWYVSLDPKAPLPSTPRDRQDVDGWLARRSRVLMAAGIAAGVFVLALVISITIGGAPFPRGVSPDRDGADSGSAVGAGVGTTDIHDRPPEYERNWPWFRGPSGMGIVGPGDWPTTWDVASGNGVVWKTAIGAPGNSSPVVWGDRVFLAGATAEKQEVSCFDRAGGKELWRAVISPVRPPGHEYEVMQDTGHAASTPATDGRHVYVTYASADIAAVDFDGNVVWERNLGNPDSFYGRATSLLIYKGKLIVQFDRGGSAEDRLSALLALDTRTGKTVWRTPRPVDNDWSTPVLARTPERMELLTSGDPWVIAYNPETGAELWRAKGLSDDVAPSPVYANGLVFVTNEYAKAMAIRTGGDGDVTETHVVWTSQEGLSDAASPIANEEFFLQANSSGRLTCFEAQTGELLWDERIECQFWASPALVGDTVYLSGEDGGTYFFKLAREYSLIGVANVGEPIFASPAFVDGQVFIRGEQHLFCIGK